MKQYIREQADILSHILEHSDFDVLSSIKNKHQITIAASGTSKNAALVVKAALAKANIQMNVEPPPFQLQHCSRLLETSDLVIAISHTGKSKGTLDCAKIAHDHGITTIGITGYMDSPLTQTCDYNIDIGCGNEPIGPKTKGYMATCLTLFLVLFQLLKNNHDFTYQKNDFMKEWLQEIKLFNQTIEATENFLMNHQEWAKASCVSVIGYGIQFGVACEGNLKLLETMQIPAMCYELEEFMHGAHRTITENSYLIFLHVNGEGYDLMSQLINFAHQQNAHLIVIEDNQKVKADLYVPYLSKTKAVFTTSLILQVMASYLPECKGINPSDPLFKDFATTVGTRVI